MRAPRQKRGPRGWLSRLFLLRRSHIPGCPRPACRPILSPIRLASWVSPSIQRRLARRPSLPAAVNPQPLVRIASNPRLEHLVALSGGFENVGLGIRGSREVELLAEAQNILPLRR